MSKCAVWRKCNAEAVGPGVCCSKFVYEMAG